MTLSVRFSLPRAIEQGKPITLDLPVYSGTSTVIPTLGAFRLLNASRTTVVSRAVSNLGTNEVALVALDTSGEDRGDGWLEEWDLTIDGRIETFRREAALVYRAVYPLITGTDLERLQPGIDIYLPEEQTSWEPQIGEAWDQLQGRLEARGNRVNLIVSSWALRNVHLYWSAVLIAQLLQVSEDGRWGINEKRWGARVQAEWDSLSFSYDSDDDGTADTEEAAVHTLFLCDVPGYMR